MRDRNSFKPQHVFVARDAEDDAITQRVLSRLPDAEVSVVDSDVDPLRDGDESDAERFTRGKRTLMLKRFKGEWLRACPGTSSHVCCNLWIVNPGEGCPLDCTYCYLQSYLKRNPTLKLYTNISELLDTLRTRAEKEPSRLFRVGTGELIDSLVWDDLTDLSCDLVPFFASVPNLMLELKSKDSYVDNLLDMRDIHNGKTVVSWSVNAKHVSAADEAFTASLEERIEAAEKVVEAGYRVGFHFDPLIHFPGWEDGYADTIRAIFSRISPKDVAWVSISSLRYKRELQEMMIQRFPQSKLPFGEQFLAKDGKLRYIQPLRFQLLRFMWDELKAISADMPVYMCMESSAAWRDINGGPPVAGSELVEVFSRKGRLPILSSQAATNTCSDF